MLSRLYILNIIGTKNMATEFYAYRENGLWFSNDTPLAGKWSCLNLVVGIIIKLKSLFASKRGRFRDKWFTVVFVIPCYKSKTCNIRFWLMELFNLQLTSGIALLDNSINFSHNLWKSLMSFVISVVFSLALLRISWHRLWRAG